MTLDPQEAPQNLRPASLYKIGGSLLDSPGLPQKLPTLLHNQPSASLLAGGGEAANVVRGWDQRFSLGEETSHQLAVQSLQLTAQLLQVVLPQSQIVSNPSECEQALKFSNWPIFDPLAWLLLLESTSKFHLPHNWQSTSDTIALWLCLELKISRLILVKSVPSPNLNDLKAAAEQGMIDQNFPDLFEQARQQGISIQLEWICLR